MFSAAFTLLVATEQLVQFAASVEFLRRWFLSPATPPVVLKRVHLVNKEGGNRHPLLATALDQVRLWQELDSRARSKLQSCLLNALRPLLSPAAAVEYSLAALLLNNFVAGLCFNKRPAAKCSWPQGWFADYRLSAGSVECAARSGGLLFFGVEASPVTQMSCAPAWVKISLARAISLESSVWTEIRILPALTFPS